MGGRLRSAWDHTPLPLETIGGITAATVAQRARPLRLPGWTAPGGWVLISLGLTVIAIAVRERGTEPLDRPRTLVVRGLHARSRNPMYLGFDMAHLGLAGATRNVWMLGAWPASVVLLHIAIRREEGWLRARFGAAYDAYEVEVPRYL